jgi:hypothetical protein
MGRTPAFAGAVIIATSAVWSFAQPAQQPRCLHGPSEQQNHRTRRDDALRLAQAINRAENTGPAIVPGQRRTYKPLDQLPGLPATPTGFSVQFHTDGATYTFSLRDTLDACHFTIFSDQEMWVYEATPRSGVEIRPVETR